jgi:endonuclease/exonuclease/phosphatase family metal-dependent hydrolase
MDVTNRQAVGAGARGGGSRRSAIDWPMTDGPMSIAKPSGMGVRVLTLNVWGTRGDWVARREVLRTGIGELDPDLIAFIEPIKTTDYDQVVDLIGDSFHVAHQAAREADGQGSSIASRWPIDAFHEFQQDVTPRVGGGAATTLVADVLAPAPIGRLLFANHVPSWQADFELERELQAVAGAQFIERLCGDSNPHVILAGDLTADPDCASVRYLCGRQSLEGTSVNYRDAWASVHPGEVGETSTPENPLVYDWDWPYRRLDYVLVRVGLHGGPTLEIAACERVFCRPVEGVWASDHFGVVADLVPPTRQVPLE